MGRRDFGGRKPRVVGALDQIFGAFQQIFGSNEQIPHVGESDQEAKVPTTEM
jgi:hypothetical protein